MLRRKDLGFGGYHDNILVAVRLRDQLLRSNVERFRGGLVFEAHRLLYHSTLGARVIRGRRSLGGGGVHHDNILVAVRLREERRERDAHSHLGRIHVLRRRGLGFEGYHDNILELP